MEHLTESLAVLEHNLPQFFSGVGDQFRKQSKTQERVNKNSVKSSKISDEVRSVLRQRLSSEYELYQFIKQKLLRQYETI